MQLILEKRSMKRSEPMLWKDKTDKLLAGLPKKRKRKERGPEIRNEREDITTNTRHTQRIVRDYCEQLCTNRLDNPEEHNQGWIIKKRVTWTDPLLVKRLNR